MKKEKKSDHILSSAKYGFKVLKVLELSDVKILNFILYVYFPFDIINYEELKDTNYRIHI